MVTQMGRDFNSWLSSEASEPQSGQDKGSETAPQRHGLLGAPRPQGEATTVLLLFPAPVPAVSLGRGPPVQSLNRPFTGPEQLGQTAAVPVVGAT